MLYVYIPGGPKKWYLSYNVIYVRAAVSLFWPTLYIDTYSLEPTICLVSNLGARQHFRSAESSTLYWFIHASFDSQWSVILSVWLPHGHGTLYHYMVGHAPSLHVCRRDLKTVLFRSSFPDATWQCTVLCQLVRRSVLICLYWLLQTDFNNIVRWSCSSSAITPPK